MDVGHALIFIDAHHMHIGCASMRINRISRQEDSPCSCGLTYVGPPQSLSLSALRKITYIPACTTNAGYRLGLNLYTLGKLLNRLSQSFKRPFRCSEVFFQFESSVVQKTSVVNKYFFLKKIPQRGRMNGPIILVHLRIVAPLWNVILAMSSIQEKIIPTSVCAEIGLETIWWELSRYLSKVLWKTGGQWFWVNFHLGIERECKKNHHLDQHHIQHHVTPCP